MSKTTEPLMRGQKPVPALLREYKQRGCNILVVGDVPDNILNTASARLLGDPAECPRTRVFGLFDRNELTVRYRLQHAGYGRTSTRVVTTTAFARSASADGGDNPVTTDLPYVPNFSLDVATVDSTNLEHVASILVDAFDATQTDEYNPGELRVCIDSLRPLLDEDAAFEATDAFLDTVTSEITTRRGMGHFVLPTAADSPAVKRVRDHFDIIVPLRTTEGTAEQRWQFVAENRQTDWLEL